MARFISPTVFELPILNMLTSMFAAAAATTKIRLYQNNYVPGPGTVLTDLTEADFDGYAQYSNTVWNAPTLNAITGRYDITSGGAPTFTQTGTVITNTVYGWYMVDGSDLVAVERFDTPVEFDTNGKTLQLAPEIYALGIDGPSALLN
jgi:hypothetical protein